MSGVDFQLDSNVIIGLLKSEPAANELKQDLGIGDKGNAFSQISRMELLSFKGLKPDEEARINEFLSFCHRFQVDERIEAETIAIRRQSKLLLPDAIIAATAVVYGLTLVTLDKRLAKFMEKWVGA